MSMVSWANVPRLLMLTSGTSAMARIAAVLLSVLLVRGRPGGGWGSEWNLEGVVVGGSSTLLGPQVTGHRLVGCLVRAGPSTTNRCPGSRCAWLLRGLGASVLGWSAGRWGSGSLVV